MTTITIEVSVPDDLRERFEARVRAHGGDQSRYVGEVVERDLRAEAPHPGMSFREIFAPAQEGFAATGMTEEVLADFVEAEVKAYRMEHGRAKPTGPGFVNHHGQEVVRRTDRPGTDHVQYVYELRCQRCGHRYGANGSDTHLRKCPSCLGGRPGLRFE
jgi:hypothetical protein